MVYQKAQSRPESRARLSRLRYRFQSVIFKYSISFPHWLVGGILNEQGGVCRASSESSFLPSSLILLLGQVLWSKFPNPVLSHLISPIGLPVKIGILIFSEVPLPITGRSLQRASSGNGRLHGRKGRWPYNF